MSRFSIEAMPAERWQRYVGRWLDSMPGDEWRGSPTDAVDELEVLASYGDHKPRNPFPMLERAHEFIRSKGWELSFGRSGSASGCDWCA